MEIKFYILLVISYSPTEGHVILESHLLANNGCFASHKPPNVDIT